MNKILVVDNKIDNYSDGYIEIKNNKITFLESNSYYIEFNNSNNINIEFNVKDGVSLFLDILSLDNSFNNKITYNIYDSNVLVNIFYCNKSSRDNININLNSDGSRIDYYFSEICRELSDYKINVYHNNKNTISNIYKLLNIKIEK